MRPRPRSYSLSSSRRWIFRTSSADVTISAASSSAQPPPSPQTSGESIFSSPAPPEAVSSTLFTGFGSTASSTGSS